VDGSLAISGTVTPDLVKSGDSITLRATADSKAEYVVARIFGDSLDMVKGVDGAWSVIYTVPEVFDGEYQVYLTASNSLGNRGIASVPFTVDNTPPALSASITPNMVKAGEQMQVTAEASDDAMTVSAAFGAQKTNMNYSNRGWTGEYTVPADSPVGSYGADFEASDSLGNMETTSAAYSVVDNEDSNPTSPTNPPTEPSQPNGPHGGSPAHLGGSSGTSQSGSISQSGSSGEASQGGSSGGSSGSVGPGEGGKSGPGDSSSGSSGETQDDSEPGWVWAIIIAIIAFLLVIVIFPELLTYAYLYLSLIIPFIMYLLIRFWKYIVDILMELPIFILSPGVLGVITMILRIILTRFPFLAPIIEPLLDALYQYSAL